MKQHLWSSIGRAFRLIWQMDRWLLIQTALISLIESVTPFIGIWLSAYVMDGLQTGQEIQGLIRNSVGAVGLIFLLTVLKSYLEKLQNVHRERCGSQYHTLMSVKTIAMDYPLLDSPKINELRTRIRNDNNWGAGFYSLIWQMPWLLGSCLSILISIGMIIPLFLQGSIFDDGTAVILLALFAATIVFHVWFRAVKEKEFLKLLDESSGLRKKVTGYFLWKPQDYHHGKDIRIYGAKPLIQHKMEEDAATEKQWQRQTTHNQSQIGLTRGLTAGMLQIFAYIFVVIRATDGALSAGSVVKYAGIIYQLSQAITDFFAALEQYKISSDRQKSTLEYLNMEDVLKKGSLPVEKRAYCEGGDNEYEIEFRNVSFKYPGVDQYALRHVNLKLQIGQRLAVVGMNGSGKTTFIKLLCRLYDPTEGEILLNGIDIRKYSYKQYLSIFSVVFQDFKLFSFALGQNVAASIEYDPERATECLKQAGFGERLAQLPAGLNTCLYKDYEENGVEVSGGEAQKIAIARALYKDAPFIVLDEPTAALDPIAEADIYAKFNEMVGNKTAIYISHRLSSCRFCDEIAVFDQGQIVQRGNHEKLLAETSGKYQELWYAQAQYYES